MQILQTAVQWIIVPAVLLSMLVAAGLVAGRQAARAARRAARAGFWAGLTVAAFVIVVLPRAPDGDRLSLVVLDGGLSIVGGLAGVVLGVLLPIADARLRDGVGVGLVAGFLSGTAGLTLALYAVLAGSRLFLVPFALVFAVTALFGAATAADRSVARPLLRQL